MAILRSGKHTRIVQKTITKSKTKKLFKKFAIKDCFINLERIKSDQNVIPKKRIRYNLRSNKNVEEPPLAIVPVREKKLVIVCESNRIWNELISREYLLAPGVIVIAKMNKFRPWPARINTIYRVGDVLKCFVLFYGTFQIGSVSKGECVSIEECGLYLSTVVKEIKDKFKWKLDYEKIANENHRAQELCNLTQVQQFLLAIRDIERLKKVPLEHSLTV